MKRTLLAVGIAILVSMMLVPRNSFWYWSPQSHPVQLRAPFFMWWSDYPADMTGFILQTVFAAVLFAVIANLLPRRK
jgi:hypothetical protein